MDKNELIREEITLTLSQNLLKEIKAGDFDHGLSVAEMLLSEGPNLDPSVLIILVESVIELASQAGSSNAQIYLKDQWPTLKASHLRRLKNKSKSMGG